MGLTYKTSQKNSLKDMFNIYKIEKEHVIALAGNPNTGKSTVFNSLTGLRQHTGNWPGKTVVNAMGSFNYKNDNYVLVDLPGTYSLFASSVEEAVARDFICFGNIEAVIVVADATCLERNLNLLFQIMELTDNVIFCINLIDEAKKKNITIDGKGIEKELGIPVILTAARSGLGINELLENIRSVAQKQYSFSNMKITYCDEIETLLRELEPLVRKITSSVNSRWLPLRLIDGDNSIISSMEQYLSNQEILKLKNIRENLILQNPREKIREYINEENYKIAKLIKDNYIKEDAERFKRDEKIDNIITSKRFGIPLMLLLLGIIFWITIKGANFPSQILSDILFSFEKKLTSWFTYLNAPSWLHGVLVLGLYRTLAWVVSVMLPPMAIFFPIFTLLEDLGYLPRIAFNMDHLFKRACAHGKQCLTMCMGFGCNAAGVIGCRIIESPRERIIAILTNNFVPCNGRFPTLIAISTIFFTMNSDKKVSSLIPALSVTLLVIVGIVVTLFVSYFLSKTVLKGIPSSFTLELPPYRRPQFLRLIYTSVIDRTVFVLLRAALIAAPAGAAIWVLGNAFIGNMSILDHIACFLDPIGKFIGLDGFILMAFILGLPANEIVLPILLMAYLSTGSIIELDSIEALNKVLQGHGWTPLTALNTMLFSLLHWPCSTTLWTIKKETQSIKWTIFSIAIPTLIAFSVCFITTCVYRLIT